MAKTEEIEHDMRLAAFNQNHMSFRSLNQQMWQIPLIAMTLTGGLWFGVSRVEHYPFFQMALLLLASVANIALIIILQRLRFVMRAHLDWLQANYPAGFIAAEGEGRFEKPYVVRTCFQIMLALVAVTSIAATD